MFTVDAPAASSAAEVVYAWHPPTKTYRARVLHRSPFRDDSIIGDTNLRALIAHVNLRYGEMYVAESLIRAVERWRPRVAVASEIPATA